MDASSKSNLTKQDVIDIIIEDVKNNGVIMNHLKKYFDPHGMIGYVNTSDEIQYFTYTDLDKMHDLKKKGLF